MTNDTPSNRDDRDDTADVSRRSVLHSVGVGAGASIVGGLAASTGANAQDTSIDSTAVLPASRTRTLASTALRSRRVASLASGFESRGFDAAIGRARAYRVETDERRLDERNPVVTVLPFESTAARSDDGLAVAFALLSDSGTGYDVDGLLGITVERDRRITIHGGRDDVVVSLWEADDEATTIDDRRVATRSLTATAAPDWCEICEEAMTMICDMVGDGDRICSSICPDPLCRTICSIILGIVTGITCGDDPTSLCHEFGICERRRS
ncbi:hypothetical protein [Halovivax cerinus]|uniref:Uncharacterized protein n=1 Tax=Halovivax cerinus TaxID=1487865 RepID=A0ABD5NL58_9EURY|nr:hypothetical protein [Halovivax cerinus]